MSEFNAFVSAEYPVLLTVERNAAFGGSAPEGEAVLSLALLVRGIPSFLATIRVGDEEVEEMVSSLSGGMVRVAAVGVSVQGEELPGAEAAPVEPWKNETDGGVRSLPAAFLSLVCSDGRRIGVAKIVAREGGAATPDDIARFVLHQIARGVQIPDLASTP
jgi:hypothetical protein